VLNNSRGRGRPAGGSTARADILEVARRRFLTEGYAAVSLRSIAREAGVDPALVSYHFGSKSGLFAACLDLAANPPQILARVLEGPVDTLPERLVATVLAVWDDPATGPPLRMVATEAVNDPETGRLFREMVEREVLGRIAEHLGGRQARQRAAAAGSQLAGLIFLRYVLRVEPVASMSRDELVRHLTPTLRVALAPRR
jgi:AcrR family transcriptional regulator